MDKKNIIILAIIITLIVGIFGYTQYSQHMEDKRYQEALENYEREKFKLDIMQGLLG